MMQIENIVSKNSDSLCYCKCIRAIIIFDTNKIRVSEHFNYIP